MIPARFAPILFGFILSCLMSSLVAGIATYRVLPPDSGFVAAWLPAWLTSWMISFPIVLLVAPVTRKIVTKLTKPA